MFTTGWALIYNSSDFKVVWINTEQCLQDGDIIYTFNSEKEEEF